MKRVFIQVEVPSKGYKSELKRLIGPYMSMSAAIRQRLETEFPSLKSNNTTGEEE